MRGVVRSAARRGGSAAGRCDWYDGDRHPGTRFGAARARVRGDDREAQPCFFL